MTPLFSSSKPSLRPSIPVAVRLGFAALLLAVLFAPGYAQVPQLPGQSLPGMTSEEATRLAERVPAQGQRLRQRLLQSGLTPDEIRSRLRGAGFPASLLDQYLTGDTLVPPPGQEMLEAVATLGLAKLTQEDSLLLADDLVAWRLYRDSLRIDSIIKLDSLARLTRRLELFGLETFRRPSTQFLPFVSGPVDPSYHLGPGDGLGLILTGEVEAAYSLDVTREGFIVVPEVGQIFVNNLTLGELRDMLYGRLSRVYSGVTRRSDARTRFDVTVTRVRAIIVRVAGEVNQPGSYQIAASGGALSALYEAAGLTERANFRAVEVRRGSELVGRVDLYDYLLRGITPTDLRLSAGDVVFVPVRGSRVKIAGAVTRPAIYELKSGETLRDLIRLAGGLTPEAAATTATIDRILPPEERPAPGRSRTVLSVSLGEVLDSAGAAVPLVAGDSVTVFSIRGPRTMAVTIEGSVWQAGTYRLEPGMRLSDLIAVAGGLRPETYAERAQIIRSRPDSTRYLIGVALDGVASSGSTNDPALRETDRVTIFARTDFRRERHVAVWGSVKKPGVVAYADSMTVRDAVLLAGGITEDAYLYEAEVSRVRMDGASQGDSLAVVFRVPLDSTYLPDPTSRVARPVGAARSPDVYLTAYDNVFIRGRPGREVPHNVVITGEVRFPGRYTLTSKSQRLTDLIDRAGGLTPEAYPNGIRFFRMEIAPRPKTEVRRVVAQSLGGEMVERLVALPVVADTTRYTPPPLLTRVGVDLARVLRDRRHNDNLILATGDSIEIPPFVSTVRVEGAVNSPSTMTHVEGAGISYYVDAAGGYSRFADRKGRFVLQPNGLISKKAQPEPGAVVVVPPREIAIDRGGINVSAILSTVTQLVAAVTTFVVVLTR